MLGIGLGVLYVAAIAIMRHRSGMFTDEVNHYPQIVLLLRGDYRALPDLTTIPGFHAVTAAILRLCGAASLDAARLANAGFGLLATAGFHALRRHLWPGSETLATAQWLVLPVLVPLFFIVYTDVFALVLLLWATWATLRQHHVLSALALLLLVGVRQHEVVWVGCLAALAVWPLWRERGIGGWRIILATGAPYLLPVAGFVGFWAWNGSISLSSGQAALHPDLSLHLGNIFFALFLAGVLLPLQVVAGWRDFLGATKRRPWLALVPPAVFAVFWWGFHVDNPYNTVWPWFYIRNGLLLAVDGQPLWRAAFGLVATAAACGLAFTRLRPPGAAWLYVFAAVFLAASWLIEQRYVLVPFVLWLAFREQRGALIEYATFALWLVLAIFVFAGMVGGHFFL
ncbi:MAG: hypothetical protein J0H15_07980 [Xanthomonadales bacterium]|nr:hypothetical protein [Xanthomonadales bacterium]